MPADVLGYGFAALVALGGVMGYVKKRSTMSLGAGLVFGGALALGAYRVSEDPNSVELSLATSAVLAALMGYRFYCGRKVMPAGLVACISLLFVARYGYRAISQ